MVWGVPCMAEGPNGQSNNAIATRTLQQHILPSIHPDRQSIDNVMMPHTTPLLFPRHLEDSRDV